jgi:hypothetical protein
MILQLTRLTDNGVQTIGHLRLPNGSILHTLELPWKNNQRKISCVPKGTYKVVKRNSPKYGAHFHLLDVANRDFILIHHGNYFTDILGCILVGTGLKDINNDGQLDVTNSRLAMKSLNESLPQEFTLNIV